MSYILALILSIISIDRVDNINKLTKAAEKSFIEKNYKESIENYKILIDSFEYENEKVYLNLGHSYLLSGDTLNAIESYNYASLTENKKVKSIAYQQLGNVNEKNNKLEEALNLYKKSIIADNNNTDSKFNYELVKKKMEKEKKDNKDNKDNKENKNNKENNKNNSDNKKQDQKGKEEKNKEDQKNQENESKNKKENNENKSNEESIEEKLKKINMSKKKAEMILDALNNNEFQYIQQLKRKPSKKLNKNKPDW